MSGRRSTSRPNQQIEQGHHPNSYKQRVPRGRVSVRNVRRKGTGKQQHHKLQIRQARTHHQVTTEDRRTIPAFTDRRA